jgi:hypothetical protein
LVCGDCREKAIVGRLWGDGGPKIRLIWTDPAYGVAYTDKNKFFNRSDRGNRIQKPNTNHHLTAEETEALFASELAAIVQHYEPDAACYATVPRGPLFERFMRAFKRKRLQSQATLVSAHTTVHSGSRPEDRELHPSQQQGWLSLWRLASRPGMTEMQERIDAAVVEWARRIPVGQIPSVLAFLSARLLAEGYAGRNGEDNGASARDAEKTLDGAERLGVLESWVRTEERAGRIPSVRLGKYVRFRLNDVERTLAERQRHGA